MGTFFLTPTVHLLYVQITLGPLVGLIAFSLFYQLNYDVASRILLTVNGNHLLLGSFEGHSLTWIT